MPFIILQRTPNPIYRTTQGVDLKLSGLYVCEVNRRGELVLGERTEALRFKTEEEARNIIERAGSPPGTEIKELKGRYYRPDRPSTPLGWILMVLETEGPLNLEELYEKLPREVSENLTLTDTLTLVQRVAELVITVPPAVDLLLLQDHIKHEHAPRRAVRHKHAPEYGGEDEDEVLVPAKPHGHQHADDIDRLGKEVKRMATKTKTKAKKAEGNGRVKKEKVLRPCHCGCGGQTFSNFTVGHDARVYGLLRKEAKGEKVNLSTILTDNGDLLASMREKVH